MGYAAATVLFTRLRGDTAAAEPGDGRREPPVKLFDIEVRIRESVAAPAA